MQYDDKTGGGCNKACEGDDSCQEGTCVGANACNACATEAETGACEGQNVACAADPDCKKFEACFTACGTQACQDACLEGVTQETLDIYNEQIYCVCDFACANECSDLCG